jgi:hypothetical protein
MAQVQLDTDTGDEITVETGPRRNYFADVEDVSALIYQTVGAGSVCWENPGGAGIFDDQQARQVAQDCLVRLSELLEEVMDDPPGAPKVRPPEFTGGQA